MQKPLQLYLHIPFCQKKCVYCDFLSFQARREEQEEYVQAMIQEIHSYHNIAKEYEVPTIFLGGGTPSILEGNQIQRILSAVNETFRLSSTCEITIEANPGTVTLEKLQTYKQSGINRISFGLQTTHNEELKALGRIHTYEEFLESYELAKKVGFDNINVDLISAIPKQTVETWKENLQRIVALHPQHISAYSLIVEEGTPFYDMELQLPKEEEERLMYYETQKLLKEAGYEQYEVSNYAKVGYACKHNIGYWKLIPYLGLGLGASSFFEEKRFRNTSQMDTYLQKSKEPTSLREEVEDVTTQSAMEEFMFLGLRMTEGISEKTFQKRFQIELEQVYQQTLQELIEKELIFRDNHRIALTQHGRDVSNYVLSEFLL